ncbi:hypothetical protein CDD82_6825 [Ophiocordyceps australis]|uniref:Signal recognition particle subunit SRP68 n=1 Tax=Ophiocordyceps australis TaxID=1399860 RepID=A0A2C5YUD9_9HYPO|nr:hypothetical protein CDD82_6825 [Ophiocordyceps australis]
MDLAITAFVVHAREQALLYGDYATYHAHLAKRLLSTRKKLGIATKNRSKFVKRPDLPLQATPDDKDRYTPLLSSFPQLLSAQLLPLTLLSHVRLLLLTSERAWAQAMSFKSAQTTAQKPMTHRTRSHIVSRLDKASRTAQHLVHLLANLETPIRDILEAKAYVALIRGAMFFEKRSWHSCVQSYSISRVIYNLFSSTGRGDLFKDLLSETIDPCIRYAAYQQNTPRTVPVHIIVDRAFPRSDGALVKQLQDIDPVIFTNEKSALESGSAAAHNVPQTLTWTSRQVQIEDAQISLAWAAVNKAKWQLAQDHVKLQDREPRDMAVAYDDILTATQEAVDATKQAIDELRGEGIAQSDPRMQRLQITRTAVNYEMISWRIGRNRVLTGRQDGAPDEYSPLRRKKAKSDPDTAKKQRELPNSKKLTKLKEKVALYDGMLQNIDSTKELPGVPADENLSTKLDAFRNYFQALKCLSIARSHAVIGNCTNALALISRALELCNDTALKLQGSDTSDTTLLNMEVTPRHCNSLKRLLNGELERHRALVYLDNVRNETKISAEAANTTPLMERLDEYPIQGVQFDNIVDFPPKLQPIPIKPIFLDVAWNYIDYPGKPPSAADVSSAPPEPAPQSTPATRRGWFTFGRS